MYDVIIIVIIICSLLKDLSERHPVVFHPLMKDGSKPQRSINLGKYRINQQSRSKIGIDGAESLNNRITHVTIDQVMSDGINRERDRICTRKSKKNICPVNMKCNTIFGIK